MLAKISKILKKEVEDSFKNRHFSQKRTPKKAKNSKIEHLF